jgi:hypothetical protein
MTNLLVGIDPVITAYFVRISDQEINILQEVLSPEQIDVLSGVQKRQQNLRSINYPWGGIGKRMRQSGN